MNSLADGLKNLDVDGSRTPVITIIVFIVTSDPAGALLRGRDHRCPATDPRDNETDVEAQNGGICVDFVGV